MLAEQATAELGKRRTEQLVEQVERDKHILLLGVSVALAVALVPVEPFFWRQVFGVNLTRLRFGHAEPPLGDLKEVEHPGAPLSAALHAGTTSPDPSVDSLSGDAKELGHLPLVRETYLRQRSLRDNFQTAPNNNSCVT